MIDFLKKEIESKILDINIEEIEQKLKELGCKFEGEQGIKDIFFDSKDGSFQKKRKTLRLRAIEHNKTLTTVLSYKEKGNLKGTDKIKERWERNYVFDNELDISALLLNLDFVQTETFYKRRRVWTCNNILICFDSYLGNLSHIPNSMEIEGDTHKDIEEIAMKLGFKPNTLTNLSLRGLIEKYKVY